jgi:hypothetical protein
MLTLRRVNPKGKRYSLLENSDGSTTIMLSDTTKHIKVNHHIDMLNQAWYNWQVKGEFIQKAFSFLSPDEREFLITGLTSEEWNELFPETEY